MHQQRGKWRDRKLTRWTVAYLTVAWLAYQGLALLADTFEWPPVVLRVIALLLPIGLLLTLVLAWYHGEKGRQRVGGWELAIIVTLLAIGAALIGVFGPPDSSGRVTVADSPSRVSRAPSYQASIAVLPFEALGSGDDGKYFGEGVTEEIIGQLAQISGLKVISRISVTALNGSGLTLPQIADTLGVRHVLQGTVRRSGKSMRVSVQLMDAKADSLVWTDSYDRDVTDVVGVQEDIARQVSTALLNKVSVLRSRSAASRAENQEVYAAYFEGTYWRQRRTRDGLLRAIASFEKAIALDSSYAPAYAGLASALTNIVGYGYEGVDRYQAIARALLTSQLAIRLDPDLADGYAAHGYAFAWSLRPDSAIANLDRALRMQPNAAEARIWRGIALSQLGRYPEELEEARIATTLDPLAPGLHIGYGMHALATGHYDVALEAAQRALTIEPRMVRRMELQGLALLLLGRAAECASMEIGPYLGIRAMCLEAAGRPQDARAVADSAEREFRSAASTLSKIDIAEYQAAYFAWMGDEKNCLRWLSQAYGVGPSVDHRVIDSKIYSKLKGRASFTRELEQLQSAARARVDREVSRLRRN